MILAIIQIVISLILIIIILLQQPEDSGLGSAFGGGGSGGVARSKRGIQKFLFRFTVVLAILFLLSSFLRLIV